IMVWHTAHMDFSKPRTAGSGSSIPYHLYYHPTPRDTTPYPYGKNKEGDQPHVSLGYRHTMFETWASVQHYYAMKRVVYVVPVGSMDQSFGEANDSHGLYTLLREINLALHQIARAELGTYQLQTVGRVALSGFSAGASNMIKALNTQPSASAQ